MSTRETTEEKMERGLAHGTGRAGLLTVEDVLRDEIPTSRAGFAQLRKTTDFPQPIRLTPKARRLFFRTADVRAWLARRQAQ